MMHSFEYTKQQIDTHNQLNEQASCNAEYWTELFATSEKDADTLDMMSILKEEAAVIRAERQTIDLAVFTELGKRALQHERTISELSGEDVEPSIEAACTRIDGLIDSISDNTPFVETIRAQAARKKDELLREDSELERLTGRMQPMSHLTAAPDAVATRYPSAAEAVQVYDNMPYAIIPTSRHRRTSNPKDSMHKWEIGTDKLDGDARMNRLLNNGTMEHVIELSSKYKPIKSLSRLRGLLERAKNADSDAKDELILHNMGLVVHIAKRFRKQAITLGAAVGLEDLVQEGALGLMKAIERTELERITHPKVFSSYAGEWIRNYITRCLENTALPIRLPASVHNKILSIIKIDSELRATLGRDPTDREIAEQLGEYPIRSSLMRSLDQPEEEAEFPRFRAQRAVSERNKAIEAAEKKVADYRAIRPRHVSSEYLEYIESPELIDPLSEFQIIESAERSEQNNKLYQMLADLSERQRRIIELRFGLHGEAPHTLDEAGRKFNVVRERIRQIENQTLKQLEQSYSNPFEAPDIPEHMIYDPLSHTLRYGSANPYIWRMDVVRELKRRDAADVKELMSNVPAAKFLQHRWSNGFYAYKGSYAPADQAEHELLELLTKRASSEKILQRVFDMDVRLPEDEQLSETLKKLESRGIVLRKLMSHDTANRVKRWRILPVNGLLLRDFTDEQTDPL